MVDHEIDHSMEPCVLVNVIKHTNDSNRPMFMKDIQCPVCLSTIKEIQEEYKQHKDRNSTMVMCPYGKNASGQFTHGMCLPCALTLYFDLFHENRPGSLSLKCPSCRQSFDTEQLAKMIKVPTQLSFQSLSKDMLMLFLINVPSQLLVSLWLMNYSNPTSVKASPLSLDWLYLVGVKRSMVLGYDRLGGFLPFSIAFGYIGYAFGNSLSMTLFSLIAQRIRELLAYQASERQFDFLTSLDDANIHPNISSSLFFFIIGLCLFPTILLDKVVKPSIPVFPQFVMDISCALCLGASHFYITRSLSFYNPSITIQTTPQHVMTSLSKYPMLYSKIRSTFFTRRGFVLRFLSSTLCMIGRLISLYILQKRWTQIFHRVRRMKGGTSSFSLGILTAYLQTIIRCVAYIFDLY